MNNTQVGNMSAIGEILESKREPKEKVTLLTERVKEDKSLIPELIDCFKAGTVGEKGHCMEAMQYASKEEPDIALPYVDFAIDNFDAGGTRVKWEGAEIIKNLAEKCPEKVVKAVPKLLAAINDTSTVARWSVAHALTGIAKNNQRLQKELIPKFKKILVKEKNHGVRNVYIKALESMREKKG
jgi:hypothetical protein